MEFRLSLIFAFSFFWTLSVQLSQTFTVDGRLEAATASGSDFNAGGSMSVNGYTITVPKNFFVEFPARWVPWKDFAAQASTFTGFEVNVFGNIIDGKPTGAMMQISQNMLMFGTAYVETVDISDGSLKLVGGSKLRINDPNARFSKGSTAVPFFQADDESPSILAFSGFPMCIPRSSSDPLCPSSNRPAQQRNFRAPDPLVMVPFAAGDYIEYSGIRSGSEILAFEVAAINVQVTTSGTAPYLRVEEAIIGVVDTSLNTEFADSRFIGYTSDSNAQVFVEAIDVDPCTGEETLRSIGSAVIRDPQRNKFELRFEGNSPSKYTREYRLSTNLGTQETKNGIVAGEYIQPVTEWVFPEVDVPGAEPPENDFTNMPFLYDGWFLDGKSYGQLDPWPGANKPSAKICASNPSPTGTGKATPTANAGPDITVRPGVVVVLAGSNAGNSASDTALTTLWSQISGPSVSLASPTAAKATFTAPSQASATQILTRTFALTITRIDDPAISSADNVTVVTDLGARDNVVIDSYTWTSSQSGTISVTARSDVVNGDNRSMTLTIDGQSARSVLMTSLGQGRWSYSSRSVKMPTTVSVSSDLGGSATRSGTSGRRRRG